MMNVVISLCLIALGMGLDALYQRRIRIAECNAYETGYQQGKKEERIRCEERAKYYNGKHADICVFDDAVGQNQNPSMAAPVSMPDTFWDRLKKHGQATMWMRK